MTPRRQQDFPPQAQPVQQASSSVNPPSPQGSSLHPQIGHGHLVQALPTLVHQQPHQVMQEPTLQPQLFYPLLQQFQASTEQQKRMIMEQQQAAWMNNQAAAAGPGHNHHELVAQTTLSRPPASGVQSLPQMQVGQAVNMGGGNDLLVCLLFLLFCSSHCAWHCLIMSYHASCRRSRIVLCSCGQHER
jgi:hypothetical protein